MKILERLRLNGYVCPRCASKLPFSSVCRPVHKCENCGANLSVKLNNVLRTIGLIFVSVFTIGRLGFIYMIFSFILIAYIGLVACTFEEKGDG